MRFFTAILIAVSFFTFVHAQKKPVRSVKKLSPIEELQSFDRIKGTYYSNEKLGFTIKLPETWKILNKTWADKIDTYGKTKLKEEAINTKIGTSYAAFVAFKNDLDEAENASVSINVEVIDKTKIVDSVDYLDFVKASYEATKFVKERTISEVDAAWVGPRQYAFLDIHNGESKQRIYATVRRGFAVSYIITYRNKADLEVLRVALSNAVFDA